MGGGAIQVGLSGGSTYAVGHMFKAHFAAGGTLDTFNPERTREAYEKYVEKGKSLFSGTEEGPLRAEALARTLERLAVLRDAGDLTREEFDELKRKLIGRTA